MNRYDRHIALENVGIEGQCTLSKARILVVGAGGLGCPVLQYLTAAGIGTIGIIDDDRISISNLQRQVLYTSENIGNYKVIEAQKQLKLLNPDISINAYVECLTVTNIIDHFKKYDLIIDCTDTIATRYLINDACILLDKPFVYGAIYKFEGQVAVFNYKQSATYRCLFPEPVINQPNCSETGVLGVLPGIIGSLQATEALKIILNIGTPLAGKLYSYDSLTNRSHTVSISRNDQIIQKIKTSPLTELHNNRCDTVNEVSLVTLHSLNNIHFIDVRESHEQPCIQSKKVINIPLNALLNRLYELSRDQTYIVFCQSGMRSKQAVKILENAGFSDCKSLQEGAATLLDHLHTVYEDAVTLSRKR